MRLDDRIEIAAIGDVDLDRTEIRTVDVEAFGMQEGRDVGEAHGLDVFALLLVLGDHQAGRRVEAQ